MKSFPNYVMSQRRYLVCYDIANEKRLRRVARLLKEYGRRLQYSVFECPLTDTGLARLQADLLKIIDRDEDQVMFVSLGPEHGASKDAITAIGLPYLERPGVTIV